MSANRCIFAARLGGGDRAAIERRIALLVAFYAPLSAGGARTRWSRSGGAMVGEIRFDGARPGETRFDGAPPGELGAEEVLWWGSPPPPALARTAGLLDARERDLLALPGPCALIAADDTRLRVSSSPRGYCSLYAAGSPDALAWSSHAVAAGVLAHGRVRVDPASIADLVAAEFVGDDRTALHGVRAVPPGFDAVVGEDGAAGGSRAARERWRPVDAAEAAGVAERELLAELERAVAGAPAAVLGLTGGLDSRVVAVALAELGISFSAFTMAAEDPGDVDGAARVAEALGVAHAARPLAWWDDSDGLARVSAAARFADGMQRVGYADAQYPSAMSHWVAGVGAETGRAFYWRDAVARGSAPSPRALARALGARLEPAVAGAEREVLRRLRGDWRRWVQEAVALGYPGWAALDVVYGEQRVRRWGRGWVPRRDARPVAAFASPRLLAALASLPPQDKLTDGFGRRFVAARRPELAPPAPSAGSGRASPVRAVAGRAARAAVVRAMAGRAARAAVVRAVAGRAGARRRPALDRPWFELPPWDARPAYFEWLRDEVVASPLVAEALGDGFAAGLRERFARGDPAAARTATWAAGPVALDAALRDLNSVSRP